MTALMWNCGFVWKHIGVIEPELENMCWFVFLGGYSCEVEGATGFWSWGVCLCRFVRAPSHACAYTYKCQHSGYRSCVCFRRMNHIPFFSSDSSPWQQIWFWPLKSRHVVERRLWDLRFSMPLKENVWMGLLIRKQLEAIPHRHENSMHLPCESQTDWRGCDAGSVPITQRAKCAEWLTMIKCKRVCSCHSLKHISYLSVCRRVGHSLSIKKKKTGWRHGLYHLRILSLSIKLLSNRTPEVSCDVFPTALVKCIGFKCRSAQQWIGIHTDIQQ